MGKLDGKVALISGGAQGQGAAEAETFAAEGAKVVFGDILDDAGEAVAAAVQASGGDAHSFVLERSLERERERERDVHSFVLERCLCLSAFHG